MYMQCGFYHDEVDAQSNATVIKFTDVGHTNTNINTTTVNTCSNCLSGYLGEDGDANSLCNDPSISNKVGDACTTDDECVTAYCDTVCSQRNKTCPVGSNGKVCSGEDTGGCQMVTTDGIIISSCVVGSTSCDAECTCYGNSTGNSCSYTPNAFEIVRRMREQMCSSIYKSLDIQDVTADVVSSRASSISSVLLFMDQITDDALSNCTIALAQTVLEAVEIDPFFVLMKMFFLKPKKRPTSSSRQFNGGEEHK